MKHAPRWSDYGLVALLALQSFLTFLVIPLSVSHPVWHALVPFVHLLFAAVCALLLTRRHAVRAALLAAVVLLAVLPVVRRYVGFDAQDWRELITAIAFAFNLMITVLVGLHAFGRGQVTVHRIQGAVLVYLNVAVLFGIAFGFLEAHAPGAIQRGAGQLIPPSLEVQTAELNYFSMATITTTGYGDLFPVHPLARSLANLEAFFGQLFPAIFLARLVALHLAHSGAVREDGDSR